MGDLSNLFRAKEESEELKVDRDKVIASIIHNNLKVEAIQESVSFERIYKTWCTHTMGCSSVIKRNEVLIHATTWISFGDVPLSEERQAQRPRV